MGHEVIAPPGDDPLEALRAELDALVERMQSADAAAAGRALFDASARELGEAARSAARSDRP